MEHTSQCTYVGNGFIEVIVVFFSIKVQKCKIYTPKIGKNSSPRGAIRYKQLTFDLADLKFHVTPLFYIFLGWEIDLRDYF